MAKLIGFVIERLTGTLGAEGRATVFLVEVIVEAALVPPEFDAVTLNVIVPSPRDATEIPETEKLVELMTVAEIGAPPPVELIVYENEVAVAEEPLMEIEPWLDELIGLVIERPLGAAGAGGGVLLV